jgi:hypothetical protein
MVRGDHACRVSLSPPVEIILDIRKGEGLTLEGSPAAITVNSASTMSSLEIPSLSRCSLSAKRSGSAVPAVSIDHQLAQAAQGVCSIASGSNRPSGFSNTGLSSSPAFST